MINGSPYCLNLKHPLSMFLPKLPLPARSKSSIIWGDILIGLRSPIPASDRWLTKLSLSSSGTIEPIKMDIFHWALKNLQGGFSSMFCQRGFQRSGTLASYQIGRRKNTWLPFSYIWVESKSPKEFLMPFSIFPCVLILISHFAPFVKKANCKTQISYLLVGANPKLNCQPNSLKYVPYPNNHLESNDIKQYPLCRIHSNQSFWRQFHYQWQSLYVWTISFLPLGSSWCDQISLLSHLLQPQWANHYWSESHRPAVRFNAIVSVISSLLSLDKQIEL